MEATAKSGFQEKEKTKKERMMMVKKKNTCLGFSLVCPKLYCKQNMCSIQNGLD